MSAPSYSSRWPIYAALWDKETTKPARASEVASTARRLFINKARYVAIETKTHVPWWLIAVLHERESGARFDRQLAQGDPLNRRSTNEPISGPFASFEESAVWALHHDHLDTVVDWRIEKALYWGEAWNGWGYVSHGIPSPYLWGATTVQKPGKYVSDGVWSSTAVDQQLGIVPMIRALAALDKSIMFVRETPPGAPSDEGHPVAPPLPVNKTDTSTLVKKPAPPAPLTPPATQPTSRVGRLWHWLNS